MTWIRRDSLRTAGIAVLILAAGVLVMAEPTLALAMAPGMALMLVLFTGRAPGEELLHRLCARRRTAPVRAARSAARPLPRHSFIAVPKGWLQAFALAMRPPPARRSLVS